MNAKRVADPQALDECVALVREAVAVRRAHAAALRLTPDERAKRPDTWRLPELDLVAWYRRAEAAVRALDGEP